MVILFLIQLTSEITVKDLNDYNYEYHSGTDQFLQFDTFAKFIMYSDRITIIDNNYTANVLPGNYSYFSEFTLSICGNNFEGVYFENQNQNQETLSEQINSITKGISRSCTFIKNITFTNYIITQQIPYHLPLFINVILVNSVPPFPLRISETSSLTSNTLNPINISNIITFVDTSELFIYGNFITQNFVLADDMNFHFNESSSSFLIESANFKNVTKYDSSIHYHTINNYNGKLIIKNLTIIGNKETHKIEIYGNPIIEQIFHSCFYNNTNPCGITTTNLNNKILYLHNMTKKGDKIPINKNCPLITNEKEVEMYPNAVENMTIESFCLNRTYWALVPSDTPETEIIIVIEKNDFTTFLIAVGVVLAVVFISFGAICFCRCKKLCCCRPIKVKND